MQEDVTRIANYVILLPNGFHLKSNVAACGRSLMVLQSGGLHSMPTTDVALVCILVAIARCGRIPTLTAFKAPISRARFQKVHQ